jgi:uncharacterized protein YjiS (DUF1127 family)
MLLKLTAVAQKSSLPISRLWSGLVASLRARRQRARDLRILSRMSDHHLRDIGISRSVFNPIDRAR